MKRFLKFLPLLFAAVLATTLWSCSDDDDKTLATTDLPTAARTFLDTYYPQIEVRSVKLDHNEYDVVLANGHSVDFNLSGEWTDVDAPAGQTIPSGFYPAAIDTYVAASFPGTGINEISVSALGYDVDLVTGIDLLFSPTGDYLGIDL